MKTLKDIVSNCSPKKSVFDNGTTDDKMFKASNLQYAQENDPHGHKKPADVAAYVKAQKKPRDVNPIKKPNVYSTKKIKPDTVQTENVVTEKVTHQKNYQNTSGDVTVSKYHVSKDGKRVGFIKHTSKGKEHEKIAFFPLGATKAKAFNAKSIPGDSHEQKLAHIIKMHVKEELSIEDIIEQYKVGEKMSIHDPSARIKNPNRIKIKKLKLKHK
jgi:hypothetical protein